MSGNLFNYTANYVDSTSGFLIQNLDFSASTVERKPLLFVLKNLLQRGCPVVMSKFLQEQVGRVTDDKKPLLTAIMRFQMLVIDLLLAGKLDWEHEWKFNIRNDEDLGDFARLAVDDLLVWLDHLVMLKEKTPLAKPVVSIAVSKAKKFKKETGAINIDFSVAQRVGVVDKPEDDIIYVCSEAADSRKENDHFVVSTTDPIDYNIRATDMAVLRFFLQNLFDKQDFRDGQFSIIANVLSLHDTLGLLPTGAGKSLCYQLACLLQPCISFVVCPIKSLMYDQEYNLRAADVGITRVAYLTSDQTTTVKSKVMQDYSEGKYLFVWISPERFQMPTFRDSIKALNKKFHLAYAVIDEVHCLSEWGHDFRTSYLNLVRAICRVSKKDETERSLITLLGLTATASVNVLKDIKIEFSQGGKYLDDLDIKTLQDYSRDELDFEVVDDRGQKAPCLRNLIEQNGLDQTFEKAAIVFTPYVNTNFGCYELADYLNDYYGKHVAWYAGSCPTKGDKPILKARDFETYKAEVQRRFKDNEYNILCATKAFGMGIDKQNICYTFHYGIPSSVEALYQEAGRAGRWDIRLPENQGRKAKCYVLFSRELLQFEDMTTTLFEKSTTFYQIDAMERKVSRFAKDLFRQVRLFTQHQNDIRTDYDLIKKVIKTFFEPDTTKDIHYAELKLLRIDTDVFEKILYRLSILGIVADWTRNFYDLFTVEFVSTDEEHVFQSLSDYISKYESVYTLKKNIQAVNSVAVNTFVDKSLWYLLTWIFEHIIYNRKQSLKTLYEWCSQYTTSQDFKKKIDGYFAITDASMQLQYVIDQPLDYEKWFAYFNVSAKHPTDNEVKRIKYRVSRYLESYNNNLGLNFISGMVRLRLGEYDDPDGRLRLEEVLKYMLGSAEHASADGFLKKLCAFAKVYLRSDEQIELFCDSVLKFREDVRKLLSECMDQPSLMNDQIMKGVEELKQIKIQLYEQLSRI
ncbi:MAG: ATP-dependent DNA helicase RecQ [Bacteroidales bacterium]|nr:ATP-dependent DNA helicase RecQ [Bacteroidales bacterium]